MKSILLEPVEGVVMTTEMEQRCHSKWDDDGFTPRLVPHAAPASAFKDEDADEEQE